MQRQWVALGFGIVLLSACATASRGVTGAPYLRLDAPRPLLFDAVQEAVGHRNWTLTRVDERLGLIEAVTTPQGDDVLRTRERWIFFVRDAEVRVTRQLEAQFDASSRWETRLALGPSYRYVREHEELQHVLAHLAPAASDVGLLAGR